MSEPQYSVGTWDMDAEGFTPQVGVPASNLTIHELRRSLKALRECGYTVHRLRAADGSHDDNDAMVLVERTNGKSIAEIMEGWKRWHLYR